MNKAQELELITAVLSSGAPLEKIDIRLRAMNDGSWVATLYTDDFVGIANDRATGFLKWIADRSKDLYNKHGILITLEKV